MRKRTGLLALLIILFSSLSANSFASGDLSFQASEGIAPHANLDWIGGGSLPAYVSSSDGTKIFATVGGLYRSVDSGAHFSPVNIVGALDTSVLPFTAVWSSLDGTKLAAVQYKGDLFTSEDSGVTWLAHGLSLASLSVSLSEDLGHIYIGTDSYWSSGSWHSGGTVWFSSDSGNSWSDAASGAVLTSSTYLAVKSSLNGQSIWAIGAADLFQSHNYGASWVLNSNSGGANWGSCCWNVASSDDLQVILVGSNGNGFYLSRNGGQLLVRYLSPLFLQIGAMGDRRGDTVLVYLETVIS